LKKEERTKLFHQVDVYPVTCARLSNGRSNIEILEATIRGGAKIIQLREKESSKKDLYEMALAFREKTLKAGVLLIINDHLDVALAVDADGVHLGQDDLPVIAARRIAPEMLLGASTHSREEALKAVHEGADYINIGPIFPTGTKAGIKNILGPEAIPEISKDIQVPFTVMGGINGSNIDQVIAQGAGKVAMVTAITQAEDVTEAVRALRQRILKYS
jgi:thiamine-phosphate pyrophosphorylase